jgi:hypothetical protein
VSHTINDVQDRNPQTDSTGTHYVFARIDQQTVSMTFRARLHRDLHAHAAGVRAALREQGSWSNLRELSAGRRAPRITTPATSRTPA